VTDERHPPGDDDSNGGCGPWDDEWQSLPMDERAEYALQAVREGRWLTLLRTPIDSDLLDVIACVRVMGADELDAEALAALIRHGRTGPMLMVAIKLLAEIAGEQHLSPDWLGAWGSWALQRG